MAGHRHTYKQELINRISRKFRHTSLQPIPPVCLKDMSTSSLAAFEEWMDPIIAANPVNSTKLLPPKKD